MREGSQLQCWKPSFSVQMAETVPGVSVTCHPPLVHQAQEKKIQHQWVFTIHSEVRVRQL